MNIFSKFIAKVFGFTFQIYKNYKSENILNQIKHKGKQCTIMWPSKIIGAEYILIGEDFYCGANGRIEAWSNYKMSDQSFTPEIIIGNRVKINGNCHIGAIDSIKIGNDVLIGNGVFITELLLLMLL